MQRVPAQAGTVLFQFDLLRATGNLDFRAIVEVARFGALQPDSLAILFCHDNLINSRQSAVISQQ
jgi:hypothetical protein